MRTNFKNVERALIMFFYPILFSKIIMQFHHLDLDSYPNTVLSDLQFERKFLLKQKEKIDKVKIDRLTDYKQAFIYGGRTQRFIFDKNRCDAIECIINIVP